MSKRSSGLDKARGTGIATSTVVAVVVVVLLGVAVIGGVLLSGGSGEGGGGGAAAGPIPVTPSPAAYPTTARDGVIVAGRPAPHTLDLYEDALCPGCRQLEQQVGEPVARAVAEGRLQVRYHMVNLLDRASSPEGYSSAAGNALICAAENDAFPTVHTSLYAAQPSEGGAGYTTQQLVDLGRAAGAGPGYAPCVTENRHAGAVAQNFAAAKSDPALVAGGSFSTPTLVLDGKLQQGDTTELDRLLAGG